MSRGPVEWYVRAQGRILGPFSQSQLASLRDRGRFSEDDEVSHDRRSWMKASEVPGVYSRPTSVQTQSATAADAEWPVVSLSEDAGVVQLGVVSAAELVWFVARGDSHQGPVSQSDVERWLSTGEIGPGTLIWKQGMPTWLAASQVPELRSGYAAAARSAAAGASPYIYLPRTSGLAVASLVLALLWLCGIGSLLATISGAMAHSQISRSNGALTGKSLAVLGLILGVVGLISTVGGAIVFALVSASAANR